MTRITPVRASNSTTLRIIPPSFRAKGCPWNLSARRNGLRLSFSYRDPFESVCSHAYSFPLFIDAGNQRSLPLIARAGRRAGDNNRVPRNQITDGNRDGRGTFSGEKRSSRSRPSISRRILFQLAVPVTLFRVETDTGAGGHVFLPPRSGIISKFGTR